MTRGSERVPQLFSSFNFGLEGGAKSTTLDWNSYRLSFNTFVSTRSPTLLCSPDLLFHCAGAPPLRIAPPPSDSLALSSTLSQRPPRSRQHALHSIAGPCAPALRQRRGPVPVPVPAGRKQHGGRNPFSSSYCRQCLDFSSTSNRCVSLHLQKDFKCREEGGGACTEGGEWAHASNLGLGWQSVGGCGQRKQGQIRKG